MGIFASVNVINLQRMRGNKEAVGIVLGEKI
jgi:hypothetical protein